MLSNDLRLFNKTINDLIMNFMFSFSMLDNVAFYLIIFYFSIS